MKRPIETGINFVRFLWKNTTVAHAFDSLITQGYV